MSDSRIECSIDFDDEWIQEGCHWEYKRVFTLSWKINCILADITHPIEIYYIIGPYTEGDSLPDKFEPTADGARLSTTVLGEYDYTVLKNYKYCLRLTNEQLKQLAKNGAISLVVKAKAEGAKPDEWLLGHYTLTYECKLPPAVVEAKLEKISSTQAIFSWDKEEVADGYCVELFCKKAGSESYENVRGLSLVTTEQDQVCEYHIVKNPVENTEPTEDENIITFASDYIDTEVYITDPTVTSISFSPRQIGFDKKDEYKLIVYPYINYGGAFLSNQGTESNEEEFKLGIVRVKTADGWKEGQVWIRTKDAWVEAEGVYTKTANGWKESI